MLVLVMTFRSAATNRTSTWFRTAVWYILLPELAMNCYSEGEKMYKHGHPPASYRSKKRSLYDSEYV